jgi:enamine deaminase RidA (YjgF/YER057c/UK114 family)
MAINSKAFERQEQEKVEYDWGTLWPKYHKEKMNWATGFRTKGDVDILFLSGSTGRDPFEDGPCRTPEEERAGKGKVVGGIKEQTRATLEDIKASLEQMGASLKNIVMFRYFLRRREDVFDMRDEMYKFFEEHEPDLRQHPGRQPYSETSASICRICGLRSKPGRWCQGKNSCVSLKRSRALDNTHQPQRMHRTQAQKQQFFDVTFAFFVVDRLSC